MSHPRLIHFSACVVGIWCASSVLSIDVLMTDAFYIERDAMGDDEYHPISGKGTNLTKSGGIGYTVIDSIDTMQIMGLDEEYARARDWVANKLSFDRDDSFNTFEVPSISLLASCSNFGIDHYPCPRRSALSVPPILGGPAVPRTSYRTRRTHASRLRYAIGTSDAHGEPRPAERC